MYHYSQTDPSAGSRHISQLTFFYILFSRACALVCPCMLIRVECLCMRVCVCVCLTSRAYECVLLRVSESKDKHCLSACLPAAAVIDVDGNTETTAEELLTHERQTPRLALSFDGKISNRRDVQFSPISVALFNLRFIPVLVSRHGFGFRIYAYSLTL